MAKQKKKRNKKYNPKKPLKAFGGDKELKDELLKKIGQKDQKPPPGPNLDQGPADSQHVRRGNR